MIRLVERQEIAAPIERCFDLARSIDFHVASSTPIDARAIAGRTTGLSELGDETTWSARYFGLRFRITTRIVALNRPHFFREDLISGLPKRFEHFYTFQPITTYRTLVTDEFTFESPFGYMGALVDRFILRPKLTRVLTHRCIGIKEVAESDNWQSYFASRTGEGEQGNR